MYPEISIGPVALQTFGLMFGLGFIAAGVVIARRFGEVGKPPDWAYEMAFSALIGGLVGSRLYYLVEHWDDVQDDVLGSLFSGSGLVWYGGALGGAIAVMLWAHFRGLLSLALLDLAAVPLALGYAIGRVGCQLAGDGDYGEPWDGPWAMAYPTQRSRPIPQCTRPRSTRRSRWASSRSCCGGCVTASARGSSSRST